LRREFLALQEEIKNDEISIPLVFMMVGIVHAPISEVDIRLTPTKL